MKILITQPHGKEKLVEAFKDSGAEVLNSFKPMTESIRLIVPTVDEELWFFSRAKDWFENQGITVACSNERAVSICRDKAEFYRFCRRHGFDTPITSQFKALVKPRFGKGSRGHFKIDTSYIVQEIIEGAEYSVDYYKDENTLSIIPRVRLNVTNGESKAGTIVMNRKIIEEAERMGEELGLEYHNVMQCFFDGKDIKWIEVNCRYGGGSWMTFEQFNSPAQLLKLVKEKV